jgi:hypothetical protein
LKLLNLIEAGDQASAAKLLHRHLAIALKQKVDGVTVF